MPLQLHVIRASEFVCVDPREELDFAESRKALQVLAEACQKRGLDCALLDLRAVPVPSKPRFTPTQLAELVAAFRAAGFSRQQRLALLCPHDVHGGVKNFAFISRMRGLQVQVFCEFEAAFRWLSEGNAESTKDEITIPLKKGQPEARNRQAHSPVAKSRMGPGFAT